jgi:hypothetical protein
LHNIKVTVFALIFDMKWGRIVGVFLLLLSLVLAILLYAKVPLFKTAELFKQSPIGVDPECEPANFYNATLEPLGKDGYQVEVSVIAYNASIDVDLWVVNETSVFRLGLLAETLAMGAANLSGTYPDKPPFADIKAYAKEIAITGGQGYLSNFDHNGTYCFVLLNFQSTPQYVSVSIEEQYVESYRTRLVPSPVTVTVTVVVLIGGVCLIIVSLKRSARGAKGRSKRT